VRRGAGSYDVTPSRFMDPSYAGKIDWVLVGEILQERGQGTGNGGFSWSWNSEAGSGVIEAMVLWVGHHRLCDGRSASNSGSYP